MFRIILQIYNRVKTLKNVEKLFLCYFYIFFDFLLFIQIIVVDLLQIAIKLFV